MELGQRYKSLYFLNRNYSGLNSNFFNLFLFLVQKKYIFERKWKAYLILLMNDEFIIWNYFTVRGYHFTHTVFLRFFYTTRPFQAFDVPNTCPLE